jgi:polyhydroxyalkanoate synthesis regulator phasin
MRNIIQSGGEWFAEAQRRVQSILPGKRKDGTDETEPTPGEQPVDEPPAADATSDDVDGDKKRSLAALREWIDHSKSRLEEWQKQVDDKVRGTLETITHAVNPWAAVNKDVKALTDRIAELEAKLHELEAHEAKSGGQ